ncbi:PCC domain-containing protein [Nocardioides acrostichi]|uniref:DUF296 domain-containing protein n=1 Tax=Nocardioides acrostichi TaxID=2784339 RepID=A0A930Y6A1_9ACTN|nr:DUF296 domain-containing protein [Nocardioides acrostichi]MBF4160747.1 DUF296 domain-containing protein [Nocardioides acrostichi]
MTLRPGARLLDALDEALSAAGVTCGQVELLDGVLSAVDYCFPAIGGATGPVVGYCETQHALGPVRLLAGSATVGFRDEKRFIHCHAAWFDADGRLRGGHLWPETWIGASGLQAIVHALENVDLTSTDDPESYLPVFAPALGAASRPVAPAETHRAVMSRVCAGENLIASCAAIMREHGLTEAALSGSLGSLVGAALERASGLLIVDGPATEVSLSGRVRLAPHGAVDHQVSAVVIDRYGRVHIGLLTDDNIVAVTVELLLEDVSS